MKKGEIDYLYIKLTVEGENSFFLFLTQDGTINRRGTGGKYNPDKDMYIGIYHDHLFEKVMAYWPETIGLESGQYEAKEKKGKNCELELVLGNKTKKEAMQYQFVYESKSVGLPREFAIFVMAARNLTDPWYHAMQKMARKSSSEKEVKRPSILQKIKDISR